MSVGTPPRSTRLDVALVSEPRAGAHVEISQSERHHAIRVRTGALREEVKRAAIERERRRAVKERAVDGRADVYGRAPQISGRGAGGDPDIFASKSAGASR